MQIEPGPTPTFMASAPALMIDFAPAAVATFPATTSILGYSFLINLTASMTPFESPCALSRTKTSTPAAANFFALLAKSFPTPIAAPTINLPSTSREARG